MHNQDWAVKIYLISQILHLYMISSIDLSFLNILCMITWFISFIHFFLPSFLFVHSSFHLFVYSFINYTITVYLCCISPPHTRLPRLTKKNPINKKHQKNQGSDTVLFTWNPVPCTVPVRWWIPPTGQGDTVITQGSVTVPLGGKRARSVMYLTVNT